MFNLPQELIDLVYEFDCTKRENFDKVLEEYKQRIKKLKDDYLEYNDEEIDTFQLENFEMLYFTFYKSKRMKIKEEFNYVLYEFEALRDTNWENYCWYGIGCHPEEVEDDFSWNYKRDGTFERIYLQGVYRTERDLNEKMKDVIADFYIEKYNHNLNDNAFFKWNKKYNRKYIYN